MATQDIGGLLFGQGGSGLEEYLNPQQLQQMQQQGMMSAAAALLAASGERPVGQGIGIGQALGSALQAGQQGYQTAQTGAINTLMAKEKLREAKMNADWAAGGGVIPTAGMPVGGATPVGVAGGLPAPAGGAPAPQGMVNIGGFNVTPAQAAILRQMPRKEAMGEILKMTQSQFTQLTGDDISELGLPKGTLGYKAPTGEVKITYRPDYQYIETPSGGKILVDMNNPMGVTPAPRGATVTPSTGGGNVTPAPAVPTRTPPTGGTNGAPVYGGGMAPALKPEQIMTTAQAWDKDYRQPVENILASYKIVEDLATTGGAGISDYGILIKALKALEPNSAVMQGEADSARQMQSMADRMQGLVDRIGQGGVGAEQARLDLSNLARTSANVAIDAYNRQAGRKAELMRQYVPQAVINSTFQKFEKPSALTSKAQMEKEIRAKTVAPVAGQTLTYDPATKSWGFR